MPFSFGPLTAALALMAATLTRRRRSRAPSRHATYGGASLAARGYEDPTVLDVVEAKTAVWARSLEAASFRATEDDVHRLLAIRTLGGDTVSVLDFGGACGATYYSTRHLLGPRPLLRWVIVETVGMAARVQRHASPFQAVSSVAAGVEALQGRVDLVHSAGTLQYTSDPYAALEVLLQVRAPLTLLTRGMVTTGPDDLYLVQTSRLSDNGPGPLPPQFQDRLVSFPVTVARRDRLLDQLRRAYREVLILPDQTGVFSVENEPVSGLAVLCRDPQ